ncbi:MAG: DNA-processing protein DprA [Burkholderiaceae bacterium]|nr:DNA-processing protein DprA [Burkholderiaceae bacterium]
MVDREELAAWLRLLQTPQVGRETARRLLAAFGSPQAIFSASASALREVIGPVSTALRTAPDELEALLEATWRWLDTNVGCAVVTLGDSDYPQSLLDTADPPLLLYVQGRSELLSAASVAVVGSRNPTHQGVDNARAFAAHLSHAGLTVVSGLALGIDGAAHLGAIDGPGCTVAVLGTGLDRVYPRQHRELAHRIASNGLLVSEYPLGSPPIAAHFPQRNRLIAGLCLGTLVVEATERSGSLITARLAAEAGREVFAIPGSIHAPQSRGCHALIKQGAKLVDSAQDILEELRLPAPVLATVEQATRDDQDPLLQALGFDPVALDALVARTGWAPAELNARLLELELDGRVARLPGQLFQRVGQG